MQILLSADRFVGMKPNLSGRATALEVLCVLRGYNHIALSIQKPPKMRSDNTIIYRVVPEKVQIKFASTKIC